MTAIICKYTDTFPISVAKKITVEDDAVEIRSIALEARHVSFFKHTESFRDAKPWGGFKSCILGLTSDGLFVRAIKSQNIFTSRILAKHKCPIEYMICCSKKFKLATNVEFKSCVQLVINLKTNIIYEVSIIDGIFNANYADGIYGEFKIHPDGYLSIFRIRTKILKQWKFNNMQNIKTLVFVVWSIDDSIYTTCNPLSLYEKEYKDIHYNMIYLYHSILVVDK